jgi:hypothetical protein
MLQVVVDVIERQQTACDVEKVVTELKEESFDEAFELIIRTETAIDIVHNGGKE